MRFVSHHLPARRLQRLALCTGAALALLISPAAASPQLQNGSHGHDVLLLQQKLKSVGYHVGSLDGVFGADTERAVAEFQRDNKIRITGKVNNATWRALKTAKQRPWGSNVKPPQKKSPAPYHRPASAPLAPNGRQILARYKVNSLLRSAKSYIGVPYSFGGDTPKAFDCSGYLQYVFAENGISIPRTADEQYKLGLRTRSTSELVPGDLVFFTTYAPGASHCGIYLGNNQFIHASSSRGVIIDTLTSSYWQSKYLGGKHIVQ